MKNPTYVLCLCGFMAYLYYLFLCRIIYLLKISFGVKFPLARYHAPVRLSFKIEFEFGKDRVQNSCFIPSNKRLQH